MRPWSFLCLALLAACATAPVIEESGEWNAAARVETGSSCIVVGTLEGDADELVRVANGGSGYVWLTVRVQETLKGRVSELKPFRFYCTLESNRYGEGEPSGPETAGLIGERLLVSLIEVSGAAYLEGSGDVPGLRPATDEAIAETQVLVRRHDELRDRTPAANAEIEAAVERLVADLVHDPEAQREALRALEELGHSAIPAIVKHMDSRAALAEPRMVLVNHASDAFEAVRRYGPELVVDALAALLNQLSGESFGLDWNSGNEVDRQRSVRAWRVYANYVAGGRAQPVR